MPLKAVFFDFDLTLSVIHVFNSLAAGAGGLVPPPLAKSEHGQLARITDLDQSPHMRSAGGFAVLAFGGPARIAQLQQLFLQLRSSGIECFVITRGLVGPCRKILDQIGLLVNFSQVYGNTSNFYGLHEYDKGANPGTDARYLGSPECQIPSSKQSVVAEYMRCRGLEFNDVLFVDDTLDEVRNMQRTCQTIHVKTRTGMDQSIMQDLINMAVSGGLPEDQQRRDASRGPPPSQSALQQLSRSRGEGTSDAQKPLWPPPDERERQRPDQGSFLQYEGMPRSGAQSEGRPLVRDERAARVRRKPRSGTPCCQQ